MGNTHISKVTRTIIQTKPVAPLPVQDGVVVVKGITGRPFVARVADIGIRLPMEVLTQVYLESRLVFETLVVPNPGLIILKNDELNFVGQACKVKVKFASGEPVAICDPQDDIDNLYFSLEKLRKARAEAIRRRQAMRRYKIVFGNGDVDESEFELWYATWQPSK